MNEIEIIARGIIIREGKILLCKAKTKRNWFFPGGHVESGETILEALNREMQEEIGLKVLKTNFMGIVENAFTDKDKINHQEVNIVFETEIEEKDFQCLEGHLEYRWFDLDKISKIYVLPENLKKSLVKWLDDKKVFYLT